MFRFLLFDSILLPDSLNISSSYVEPGEGVGPALCVEMLV